MKVNDIAHGHPMGLYPELSGIIAVFAAAATWGMSGIFVTVIIDTSGCSSVALAFWRDLTTFLILFLYLAVKSPSKLLSVHKNDIPWLLCMGGFLGGFHIFYNESVMMNGAAVTTVEQAAMPAVVTFAAWRLWGEGLDKGKLIAMGIIFVGTAMASGVKLFDLEKTNIEGLTFGFLVPLFYAGWTLCGKNSVCRYGAVTCLMIAFGTAAFLLLFLQPFAVQPELVNFKIIMTFSGLIMVSTVGAFTLFMVGLKTVQAGVASILAMSEILFAGVYAWFLLGERLTSVQILGALLVITGVSGLSYYKSKL